MERKYTKEKTTRIILHVLIWALFLGLPIYSARRFQMGTNFLLIFYAFTALNAIIFYANYLFLVPRLFFRKQRYRYYLAALALVFFFYFISDKVMDKVFSVIPEISASQQADRVPEEARIPQPPRQPRRLPRPRFIVPDGQLVGYVSSSMFMIFLSLGIRVLERQSEIEKMQEEMEKAKLNTELAFLKNQISPHFFFNTLNNIYSLISINAEDSQKAVLRLSKLMRYLLYESEQGNTLLGSEIDFMKNYIDLMKLRMSEKVELSITFPEDYEDVSIPPLLFIPFIENAFKHGISYRNKSFINISLVSSGKSLEFRCSNSLASGEKDKNSGIGLENARKRLNLLFPYGHDLVINQDIEKFDVLLRINLT